MITIFTIPKSFEGETERIQRNAILSWKKSFPGCEIILFSDDAGVREKAQELDLLHISEIKKNRFGTPLIDDIFEQAQKIARNEIMMYANTDIILMKDITAAVEKIDFSRFLMCCRSWNLKVLEEIDFGDERWENKLIDRITKEGTLRGLTGIDLFIFSRGLWSGILPLAVGRGFFDNWLLFRNRILGAPLIDATQAIVTIHQSHSYPTKKTENFRAEKRENFRLIGGLGNILTLREADWILDSESLKKPPFPRRIFSVFAMFYPWRKFLGFKRKIALKSQM